MYFWNYFETFKEYICKISFQFFEFALIKRVLAWIFENYNENSDHFKQPIVFDSEYSPILCRYFKIRDQITISLCEPLKNARRFD